MVTIVTAAVVAAAAALPLTMATEWPNHYTEYFHLIQHPTTESGSMPVYNSLRDIFRVTHNRQHHRKIFAMICKKMYIIEFKAARGKLNKERRGRISLTDNPIEFAVNIFCDDDTEHPSTLAQYLDNFLSSIVLSICMLPVRVPRWMCWCRTCCCPRFHCSRFHCCCYSMYHWRCYYCYYYYCCCCCHYSHLQWTIRCPIVCQRLPSISQRPHDSISNQLLPFHST